MPPLRYSSVTSSASSSRRRRSSCLLHPLPSIKPGLYSANSTSTTLPSLSSLTQRPIAFAPNVTPGTYVEPGSDEDLALLPPDGVPLPEDGSFLLFPPSGSAANSASTTTTKKRHPPGKRPSQGYIPRPPNAFMLFRADFVKQRHVPGSIETNHGSLSKIIGNCWRQLPLSEKHYWEQRAKEEKQQHKIKHPNYRFRPVHNKNKKPAASSSQAGARSTSQAHSRNVSTSSLLRKDKPMPSADEEFRCESVAALLLEGKKGEELAQAVRALDRRRKEALEAAERQAEEDEMSRDPSPQPFFAMPSSTQYNPGLMLRRPSSVPLPTENWLPSFHSGTTMSGYAGDIAMPSAHYLPVSPSPIAGISFAAQQNQTQNQNQSNPLLSQPLPPFSHHFGNTPSPSPSHTNAHTNTNAHLGMLLRRPSSALASFSNINPQMMFNHPNAPRKSWTYNPSAALYNSYDTMPFLSDLGIENPYARSHDKSKLAETAGEPDYTLFNDGFSFSTTHATASPHVSHKNLGLASRGGNDVPPSHAPTSYGHALSINPTAVDWSSVRDMDPGLASAATTTASSVSGSGSTSAGGSPQHFAEYQMMNGNANVHGNVNGSGNGSSELDPLAPIPMRAYQHQHQAYYNQVSDPLSMMSGDYAVEGAYDMEMRMGMGMEMEMELHAPKPERTPTRVMFGDEHQHHGVV